MKTRIMKLALAALFLAPLAWGDDPCPCPGETPYAGTDACGNDVCGSNDVDTYPYMDACGNGVCDPDLDGEYPDTAYDCDGDGELDSCDECLEISGKTHLLTGTSQSYSTGDSDTSWSITSGGSFASLDSSSGASVQVEGTQPGAVTIEAINAAGQTATLDIKVFSVSVQSAYGRICDGDSMGVSITVSPDSLKDSVTNVDLKATKWDGFENFSNVVNAGCSISKSSELEWTIDNARWFAGAGDCYTSGGKHLSDYRFKMSFKIGGESFDFTGGSFTVEATVGPNECLWGKAEVDFPRGWVKGDLSTSFVDSGETDSDGDPIWEWRAIGAGNVYREIEASKTVTAESHSQFRAMIEKEEAYHVDQFEGWAPGFDPSKHWVLQNFIDSTVPSIITGKKAFVEFEKEKFLREVQGDEHIRTASLYSSKPVLTQLRKTLECDAKQFANSQFHLKMECTYGVSCN